MIGYSVPYFVIVQSFQEGIKSATYLSYALCGKVIANMSPPSVAFPLFPWMKTHRR